MPKFLKAVHNNRPVHVELPPEHPDHVHYKNFCPVCGKVSQCRCDAQNKKETAHVCRTCDNRRTPAQG
jgi:hypothetical protein